MEGLSPPCLRLWGGGEGCCRWLYHAATCCFLYVQVEERIVRELQEHGLLATANQPRPRGPDYADLDKLTYLTCVIKESMRMHTVSLPCCISHSNVCIVGLTDCTLPASTDAWPPFDRNRLSATMRCSGAHMCRLFERITSLLHQYISCQQKLLLIDQLCNVHDGRAPHAPLSYRGQ